MRFFLLSILSVIQIFQVDAQDVAASGKPPVDSVSIAHWSWVDEGEISGDGLYVSYVIHNQPLGKRTEVLRSALGSWKIEIVGGAGVLFNRNGKEAICAIGNDSVAIIELGVGIVKMIAGIDINSYRLVYGGGRELLFYARSRSEGEIVLLDLGSYGEKTFTGVKEYFFNQADNVLLFSYSLSEGMRRGGTRIDWISLGDLKQSTIFEGGRAEGFVFDSIQGGLCFSVSDSLGGRWVKSLWYYKYGTPRAEAIANGRISGLDSSFVIDRPLGFCRSGQSVLFTLRKISATGEGDIGSNNSVRVDVWSFMDIKLPPRRLDDLNSLDAPRYISVLDVKEGHAVQLETENDKIADVDELEKFKGDYAILIRREGEEQEWNWNGKARLSVYLVSLVNGARRQIDFDAGSRNSRMYKFSCDGKYIVYYDADHKGYFSYSMSDGKYRSITKEVKAVWTEENDAPDSYTSPIGIAGFVEGTTTALLYERNDIYLVDLTGVSMPINLTREAREGRDIVFTILFGDKYGSLRKGKPIILNAFNRENKDNGFCRIVLGGTEGAKLLTMQPYMFMGGRDNSRFLGVNSIRKAKYSDAYILGRMSASESPNYFWTNDFKSFVELSNVFPERKYNWVTTELIKWKMFDGRISQGILFKPSNFDPNRKYPVIFHYYEKLSDGLHFFIRPDWSIGPINVSYFVSNGYLVFEPDIYYKLGFTGKSAYNSVVSAAKFLALKPWVDSTRMGIEGHSFGGYETDYLITHTSIFAAACSASGWADFVAAYGEVRKEGVSKAPYYELRRERIAASLWDKPSLFIENSPIFNADKVTTPLLMMNNKKDDEVHFSQGEAFFTALRRLGRRVWMLQYDDGDHQVSGVIAEDFTIRMRQFFDYYLKGAQCPSWMVKGILPLRKGIDNGFQLEDWDISPGAGLLLPRKKVKITSF